MKSKVAVVVMAAALLCAGCAVTKGKHVTPDGSQTSVSSVRLAWFSDGVDFGAQDPSGFKATLKMNKSGSDPASIDAIGAIIQNAITAGVEAALKAKTP
jgi:hypothetical protein